MVSAKYLLRNYVQVGLLFVLGWEFSGIVFYYFLIF